MKLKKIKYSSYFPQLRDVVPAKKHIPDWYRNVPRYQGGKKNNSMTNGFDTRTMKHCIPFLDGMTFGYVIELWQDVEVVVKSGQPELLFNISPPVADTRGRGDAETMPTPAGHRDNHFIWKLPYTIQTPPGYSALITHPFNRFELPFTTLSAVVDMDYGMEPGNLPFFIKDGFEGLIPKGTPICQILPFKRNSWEVERDESLNEIGTINQALTLSVLEGYYKNHWWTKKDFN